MEELHECGNDISFCLERSFSFATFRAPCSQSTMIVSSAVLPKD